MRICIFECVSSVYLRVYLQMYLHKIAKTTEFRTLAREHNTSAQCSLCTRDPFSVPQPSSTHGQLGGDTKRETGHGAGHTRTDTTRSGEGGESHAATVGATVLRATVGAIVDRRRNRRSSPPAPMLTPSPH